MIIVGLLCMVAAVVCAARALRLDRELARLLPSGISRRWFPSMPLHAGTFVNQIHWHMLNVLPRHWREDLHADRGAALVRQLYLCLALTCGFTLTGFAILRGVFALAP